MWIFLKKSRARARCHPNRIVETRSVDSIGPKARPVGKDTTGRVLENGLGVFSRTESVSVILPGNETF